MIVLILKAIALLILILSAFGDFVAHRITRASKGETAFAIAAYALFAYLIVT